VVPDKDARRRIGSASDEHAYVVLCTRLPDARPGMYLRQTTERTRPSPCDAPYFSRTEEERQVEPEKTPRERAEDLIRLLMPDWRPTARQGLWAIRTVLAIVVVLGILTLVGQPLPCAVSMRSPSDRPKLRRPAGRSVSMQPAVTRSISRVGSGSRTTAGEARDGL
jgi:hypothetical protein